MKKILFVCTGNTCRSPMAAALYGAMGGEGASAGLYAEEGAPASANARFVMASRGLDLQSHRAANVTEDMVRQADLTVGMTPRHALALKERFPAYADKITAMPVPVPDPYGHGEGTYYDCMYAIEDGLRELLSREGRP